VGKTGSSKSGESVGKREMVNYSRRDAETNQWGCENLENRERERKLRNWG
jgi:hypothetical protein